VRLRDVAAKRRRAAEDVEVLILGGRELRPRQGYPPNANDIALMGQLLRWSNVEPTLTHLTIPPGARKHIDLRSRAKSQKINGAQSTSAPHFGSCRSSPPTSRRHTTPGRSAGCRGGSLRRPGRRSTELSMWPLVWRRCRSSPRLSTQSRGRASPPGNAARLHEYMSRAESTGYGAQERSRLQRGPVIGRHMEVLS
jgi:hypothetical protein